MGNRLRGGNRTRDLSDEQKHQFHDWASNKILKSLTGLGGIFIKAGQELSMSSFMFPDPIYTERLCTLHDQVDLSIRWKDVVKMIKVELGRDIHDIFEIRGEEDKVPVASASLASVYKWKLRSTGQVVAVKIQYPLALYYLEGDILAQKWSMKFGGLFDPATREMGDLMGDMFDLLRLELNFLHEAKNQEKCRKMFLDDEQVFAPKVHSEYSSGRILTMEWVDGIKPTEVERVRERYGYSPKQVASVLFRAFGEMIFKHGFVHGDLHPGNLFVCDGAGSNGKGLRVCLLDHGLYTTYTEDFRRNYARFWKALVLNDEEWIKSYCEAFGIKNHRMYIQMNTFQSYDGMMTDEMMDSGEFALPKEWLEDFEGWENMSKEELLEARKKWMPGGEKYDSMANVTKNLPPELYFVIRSMFILGFVNSKLGAPINRFNLMARLAVRSLGDDGATGINKWWNAVSFEARLAWNAIQSWVVVKLVGVYLWFASFRNSGSDGPDLMKEQMKSQMKAFKKRMEM